MSNVAALGPARLRATLSGPGLTLQTGRFATRLRTSIPHVADGIALLYADYPVLDDEAFADFHLQLTRPVSPRRWLRPQVTLLYDGRSLFKPLPLNQAMPMFEWGLNWCFASRANRYLIIHAAVLEKHGRAVILPAPPGSGKSTLCAALAGRGGWRLLSDELTLLSLDHGRIVPLPRPVSLKNGSIDVIRRYLPDSVLSTPVTDTTKGTVAHMKAPAASVQAWDETALPGWIVFPRYQAGAATQLATMDRASTFMRVADNCFNYSLLAAHGFDALANLVDATSGHSFEYSDLDEALATFDALARSAPP
jgi:HprK-related kinase A